MEKGRTECECEVSDHRSANPSLDAMLQSQHGVEARRDLIGAAPQRRDENLGATEWAQRMEEGASGVRVRRHRPPGPANPSRSSRSAMPVEQGTGYLANPVSA